MIVVVAHLLAGETAPSVHLLALNSHLWLHVAGLCSAATPRATVSTGGLNQVRGPCALCRVHRVCGFRWVEGRMEPCVGTVVTWFVSARRWTAGDEMDLHIDIALTRPYTPSETAAYGEFESLSTTTRSRGPIVEFGRATTAHAALFRDGTASPHEGKGLEKVA
nr:unnamed protein product [Spirometra erinaceieuropaei]